MKGFLVYVYRNSRLGDCTNGGYTSMFDEVILIGEGLPEIWDSEECKLPVFQVKRRGDYIYCEPIDYVGKGKVGWMMGGNYVSSSDSRFSECVGHPIPVHDRQEYYSTYEILSR